MYAVHTYPCHVADVAMQRRADVDENEVVLAQPTVRAASVRECSVRFHMSCTVSDWRPLAYLVCSAHDQRVSGLHRSAGPWLQARFRRVLAHRTRACRCTSRRGRRGSRGGSPGETMTTGSIASVGATYLVHALQNLDFLSALPLP